MFITVCARLDAYTYKCTNTCTYAHTHNTHRYICTYNHIYTQMRTHRCAHTNVHARMSHTYTYMHTYIYINTLYIYIIKVYGIHKLIHKYPVGSRTARAFSFQNPRHSGHTVFFQYEMCVAFLCSIPATVNLTRVHFEHTQSATAHFATKIYPWRS